MARCEYSCAYLLPIAHTRLRVHRAPGIPHALCFQGGDFLANLGRVAPRDRGRLCGIVLAIWNFNREFAWPPPLTLPWRGRVGSHRAKQDARRGGVTVSHLGHRSIRETITP